MNDLRDKIAAVIRRVDGDHSMGAGALAEAIVSSPEYAQVKAEAQVAALREAVRHVDSLNLGAAGMDEVADWLMRRAGRIARSAGIDSKGETNV